MMKILKSDLIKMLNYSTEKELRVVATIEGELISREVKCVKISPFIGKDGVVEEVINIVI